ncbi:MAG: Cna B-type domain-containing protein [Lachnospiraceae bacterium]|nr:Cna B-type domain-containing protein [Lachnospiraceae bacterium]
MALKKKGRVLFSTCIVALMILLAGVVVFASDSDSIPDLVKGQFSRNSYGIIVEKQVEVITGASPEEAQEIKDKGFVIDASGEKNAQDKSYSQKLIPDTDDYLFFDPVANKYLTLDPDLPRQNVFFDFDSGEKIEITESKFERDGFKLTASYQIEHFSKFENMDDGTTEGSRTTFKIGEGDTKIILETPSPSPVRTYQLIRNSDDKVIEEQQTQAGTESCVFTFKEGFLDKGTYYIKIDRTDTLSTYLTIHQTCPLVSFDPDDPDPEKRKIITENYNSSSITFVKIINNYAADPVSGLKVEKKWDHKDNPESSRPGSVTVQLKQNGKDFHPDPSDPNSGQATLNQQNNWSYIWENLPVGTYDEKNTLQKYTYTIEEITIPNYIVSSSDPNGVELTESANDDKNFPVITLTNTYTKETPKKGSLKITKKLNDAAPDEAKKKEFSFLVTGPSYPESSPKKITITGSGSQLLSDLEPGSYQVKEDTDSAQVENYLLTVTEGGTVEVTVSPGSTAEANITNTYTKEQPVTGSLQVKKAWKDAPAGTNYPEVKIQLYQSGDKYHDPVTLNNRNSWSHIWNNLPIKDESGNYYTYKVVEEKVPDGYSVSYEHNGITLSAQENAPSASPSNASMRTSDTTPGASQPEDTGDTLTATPSNASFQWRKPARSKAVSYSAFSVSKPAASSVPTITVTNTYEGTDDKPITGELSIKKTVTGNRGEQNRQFTFTITLRDEKGEQLPGSYPYDGAKKGTISSGESITLKHGESVTISALPEGTQYQVVEKEADQGGYTTSSSGTTGTIALEKTAEAAFTNHKPGGGNPGGNPPGGGGGGGGKTPKPDPDPTTPPSEVTPPPTEETPTFPETLPNRPTELPDPNSPDSPERFTIWDGDVPKTYVKVWNPETEEFMWIPEEEVPLSGMLPKTGDTSHGVLWIFIAILSLCGIGALLFVKARRRHDTSSSS